MEMAPVGSGETAAPLPCGMTQFEQELSLHLERAHELGVRAKQSNDAVEEQLRRTLQLAGTISDAAEDL